MKEKLSKNLYRAILIISFLAVNAFIILGIGYVWVYFNTGADRSSMLHTAVKGERVYLPAIKWDTTSYQGRPMEDQNLQEIERDYLNAWYVKNLALQTNNTLGIDDYYTDSARVNIFKNINYNKDAHLSFKSTTTRHHPKLKFYSADGQLVSFTDHNVLEYTQSYEQENLLNSNVDTSSYQIIMLLEDGFWRIRHMKKIEPTAQKIDSISAGSWKVNDDLIYYNNKPFHVKGINYYPKDSPWNMYGDSFDLQMIRKDFKLISSADLNTIRIFVPYSEFGEAQIIPEKLNKLKQILDLANENDLKVILTLFDFYGDYSILQWTKNHEHARQLVNNLHDHPAIMAWDIKNEPDLDFESRGKDLVVNWLKHTIEQIKSVSSGKLITIGWARSENAVLLEEKVDVVSFHFYGSSIEFEEVYNDLQLKISRPLVLGEFGMSSYDGLWNPLGYDEEDQALYHKKMQAFFKKEKLAFLSWTLYDFKDVPARVVGPLPWRKARQRNFGFLDSEGNPKPAFRHISN